MLFRLSREGCWPVCSVNKDGSAEGCLKFQDTSYAGEFEKRLRFWRLGHRRQNSAWNSAALNVQNSTGGSVMLKGTEC